MADFKVKKGDYFRIRNDELGGDPRDNKHLFVTDGNMRSNGDCLNIITGDRFSFKKAPDLSGSVYTIKDERMEPCTPAEAIQMIANAKEIRLTIWNDEED